MNHSLPDLQASSKAIFVTGAGGFIGRRLVARLLDSGYQVKVLVRPEAGADKRIPNACEQLAFNITDTEALGRVVAQSDAVFYCAGSVRGRKATDFATANINGVASLRQALESLSHPPPVLLLSSLAASQPQLSDYAFSKHAGEQVLNSNMQIPWTIFRPPAVYGPGDQEMLPLLKMIRRGLLVQTGPANQRLSLLHVDDLVAAMLMWLTYIESCIHKTYSLDDGKPDGYGWSDIAESTANRKYRTLQIPQYLLNSIANINSISSAMLGYSPMLTPGKVRELVHPQWLSNNADFTSDTNWQPALQLKQGVQQMFGEIEK